MNIKVGDTVSVGLFYGKVTALFNWKNERWAMVDMVEYSAAYKVSELTRIENE